MESSSPVARQVDNPRQHYKATTCTLTAVLAHGSGIHMCHLLVTLSVEFARKRIIGPIPITDMTIGASLHCKMTISPGRDMHTYASFSHPPYREQVNECVHQDPQSGMAHHALKNQTNRCSMLHLVTLPITCHISHYT